MPLNYTVNGGNMVIAVDSTHYVKETANVFSRVYDF